MSHYIGKHPGWCKKFAGQKKIVFKAPPPILTSINPWAILVKSPTPMTPYPIGVGGPMGGQGGHEWGGWYDDSDL